MRNTIAFALILFAQAIQAQDSFQWPDVSNTVTYDWPSITAVKAKNETVCQVCKAAGAISCQCQQGDIHRVKQTFQQPKLKVHFWNNEVEGRKWDIDNAGDFVNDPKLFQFAEHKYRTPIRTRRQADVCLTGR